MCKCRRNTHKLNEARSLSEIFERFAGVYTSIKSTKKNISYSSNLFTDFLLKTGVK